MKQILIICICFLSLTVFAQQNVGIGTVAPHASAALDVTATGKGVLVPRMTFANRPVSPATGLLIYQTDADSGFYFYNGTVWKAIQYDALVGNGSRGRLAIWNSANQLLSSSKLLFDTATNRMGIGVDALGANTLFVNGVGGLKTNTTNNGTGTTDWIANNAGGTTGDRVVSGVLFGTASIGGHNNALNTWTKFSINAGGSPVGIGTSDPDNSSLLDLQSTTRGLLLPRMNNAQRNSISTPANGLLIMQTNGKNGLYRFQDTAWRFLPDASLDTVRINPTTLDTVINFNNSIEGNRIRNLNPNNIVGTIPFANLPTNIVRGTGTTNFLPKFGPGGGGVSGILNSLIQDNGTSISMGTASPQLFYQAYIYRQQLLVHGDGQATTLSYRTRDSQNDGTGYGQVVSNRASSGFNFWGDVYTFGDASYSYNDYSRTGGNLGAEVNGSYWASAGYRSSALLNYGIYASSAPVNGSGRFSTTQPAKGIGGGFAGDLMGAWFKGNVMGSISEGSLFATYNIGNAITDGKNIELVTTADGEKIPTYSVSSASVAKIYNDGTGQLANGRARVNFDASFLATLARDAKPTITISPVGGWANLYIAKIDATGFDVAEANNGSSSIEFNYIVVGKKLDLNESPISSEVLNKNFSKNLPDVLFNEGNTKENGKPMWWDGTKFNYTTPPLNASEIEAQRKKKELIAQEQEALKKQKAGVK